jgi:hypothetical protein
MTMVLAPHRGAKTRAKAATQVVGAPAADTVADVATDATSSEATSTEQTSTEQTTA